MNEQGFYNVIFNALQKQAEADKQREEINRQTISPKTDRPSKPIPTKNDPVNHPAHYTYGKIETINFIRDKQLNFALGNAIKYIVRAGHKNNAIEDLQKAVWYINNEIETLKKNL